MRKSHMMAFCCLLCSTVFYGQGQVFVSTIKPLNIGDSLPGEYFDACFYGEGNIVRLSDYKGKLILLDLWDRRCSVCLANMPQLEELQKLFADRVQVVLITKNTDEEVGKLRNKVGIMKKISLPMITNDSVFNRLFPFGSVPTHIWIDENGVVRQMTESWNTTAISVQKYLEGQTVVLPLKTGEKGFDTSVPLWLEGGGRHVKRLQYYSYLSKQVPEFGHSGISFQIDSAAGTARGIKIMNYSIKHLFGVAFGMPNRQEFMQLNRIIDETGDRALSEPLNSTEKELWNKEHSYWYELRLPAHLADQLFKVMQQDLERFFKIKGKIEKRKSLCLVLRLIDSKKLQSAKKVEVTELSPDNREIIIERAPLGRLVRYMETIYVHQSLLFVDETNYERPIDIVLRGALDDLTILKAQLKKYGLLLTEEERDLDMLVLKRSE